MAENNQKIKLLRIIEYLRAESDAGKPVSTSRSFCGKAAGQRTRFRARPHEFFSLQIAIT